MGTHSLWIKHEKRRFKSWGSRIPILQLARSRNKKQKETEAKIEKDDFKSGSKLDWKKVKTF